MGQLNPAIWGALVVGLLFALLFVAASAADVFQVRSDRNENVVCTCMGLRLTASHLLVGTRGSVERIPLAGLRLSVDNATTQSGREVRMSIAGAGHSIERSQPFSYGASAEVQIFAIRFAQMSRPLRCTSPVALAG